MQQTAKDKAIDFTAFSVLNALAENLLSKIMNPGPLRSFCTGTATGVIYDTTIKHKNFTEINGNSILRGIIVPFFTDFYQERTLIYAISGEVIRHNLLDHNNVLSNATANEYIINPVFDAIIKYGICGAAETWINTMLFTYVPNVSPAFKFPGKLLGFVCHETIRVGIKDLTGYDLNK